MSNKASQAEQKLRKLGERLRLGLAQQYLKAEGRKLPILKKRKSKAPSTKKGESGSRRGTRSRKASASGSKRGLKKGDNLIKD